MSQQQSTYCADTLEYPCRAFHDVSTTFNEEHTSTFNRQKHEHVLLLHDSMAHTLSPHALPHAPCMDTHPKHSDATTRNVPGGSIERNCSSSWSTVISAFSSNI